MRHNVSFVPEMKYKEGASTPNYGFDVAWQEREAAGCAQRIYPIRFQISYGNVKITYGNVPNVTEKHCAHGRSGRQQGVCSAYTPSSSNSIWKHT